MFTSTKWLKALKKDLLLQVRRQKQRYLKKAEKPKGVNAPSFY